MVAWVKPETRTRIQRLLIEGTVIVSSILLAFGIDALWAQRLLRAEESLALASLEEDFAANLEQLERVIAVYQDSWEQVTTLRRLSLEEIRALPQQEVSALMLGICNPWTFDPVLGTTKALVGAGKLGILRDPQLRKALTTFINLVEDSGEDVAYLHANALDVWQAQVALGGPWTDPATEVGYHGTIVGLAFIPKATPEDLLRVSADAELMGLVSVFHLNAGYYVSELRGLAAQAQLILDLLDDAT